MSCHENKAPTHQKHKPGNASPVGTGKNEITELERFLQHYTRQETCKLVYQQVI